MATKAAKVRVQTLTWTALGILCVGTLAGMILSLSHLAETIHSFTEGGGVITMKAWCMAVVIDGFLLGAELAIIIQGFNNQSRGFSITLFVLCALLSVALNVWAFVEHAPVDKPWAKEFAIMLGITLPTTIILACVVASRLIQGVLGGGGTVRTGGTKRRTTSSRKRSSAK